jgi:transcriptional regulator with XRE-family HTH domain
MDIPARFGQNLIRCRKGAGFSQEELGLRASLHRTEISLLERGTRIPRIDTLVKLAGALGLPAERLLDGMAWRPGSAQPGRFGVGRSDDDEITPATTPNSNPSVSHPVQKQLTSEPST